MKKVQQYIEKLNNVDDWDSYLMEESGLPGPRANLELVYAVASAGSEERFLYMLGYSAEKAPVNSQEGFLAVCGTVGLGRLAAEGKLQYIKLLKSLASDSRWRVREAVAMALQIYGESHMEELLDEMEHWADGSCYEKRAAIAALCEPKLLSKKEQIVRVLKILDRVTQASISVEDRKDEGFIALKKGLAYCWSVAIVSNPEDGKLRFEKWIHSEDKDIKWIIRENLKKNRLKRMDEAWVQKCIGI